MDSLDKIAKKYNTDKSSLGHNYANLYESVLSQLKNDNILLLEIGVRQGWSHQMWCDFFPNAKIFGIDNCLEAEFNKDHSHLFERGIEMFYGNQEENSFLEKKVKKNQYNIIIDDGGHKMKEQQLSLLYLIDNVVQGGFYFIEDLHTCYSPIYYTDGVFPNDSTLILLDKLRLKQNHVNTFITNDNFEFLLSKIYDIVFLAPNLVQIIKK